MLPLSAQDMLTIWEQGGTRHAIDRALLLFAAACPAQPADRLADRPVGERNRALLRLRRATFGPAVAAYIDCPDCGARMEVALHTDTFLPPAEPVPDGELAIEGFRFRRPTSRDLCAVLDQPDDESAAAHLLERCCVARPDDGSPSLNGLIGEIEAGLEALDPCGDIALRMSCAACGHSWAAPFDIAALLWDEVEARARALLAAVHTLAHAYGWSEREILALGEQRRAAYLDLVTA